MRETLDELVLGSSVPVLGVCVGMQMLAHGERRGHAAGPRLDRRPRAGASSRAAGGEAARCRTWAGTTSRPSAATGCSTQLETDARFYFLHSYYFDCDRDEDVARGRRLRRRLRLRRAAPATSTACSFIPRRAITSGPGCCRTSRSSEHAAAANHSLPARPRTAGSSRPCSSGTPKYVGDPINAVKIFNEKEADELIVLDIDATANGAEPNFRLIAQFAVECRMPLVLRRRRQDRRAGQDDHRPRRREGRDQLGGRRESAR